jgi:uncharacterized protein YqeY
MVSNVRHDNPDSWTAEVEGSDLYSVEIKMNGDEIVSWVCDCPYDYGDICKHVVAVLLYIKDNKDNYPANIETPIPPQQEQLDEILKQTNQKELSSFLIQYAKEHPDFYQELKSNLHPQNKKKNRIDYAKEIQKCFNVRHSYDKYYRHEGADIAGNLDKYVEKAKSLIKLDCKEEALTILLLMIKEIGDSYEEYDDEGELGSACQEAVDIISEMVESGLPDNLLKTLMDKISQWIKNSNYDNYGLADLDNLLFAVTLKTSGFERGVQIIDEALKNEPDSFRSSSLVISKIELLEKAGRKDAVEQTISDYLYLPEIRKVKLEQLISEGQYEHALALIDEGIIIAQKKEHPGTENKWKDEKLAIYKLTAHNEKVIEIAEDLFVNTGESMKYYHVLKDTIPSEKWTDYLENFLLKPEKQKMKGKVSDYVLAKIYMEEEYWERLMMYVEKNVRLGKHNSLTEYESYLKPRYPERMLTFYRSQLTDYAAKNMGRDHYKYVADVLRVMRSYPGGAEIVDALLSHFRSVYSNRRAMMEELL